MNYLNVSLISFLNFNYFSFHLHILVIFKITSQLIIKYQMLLHYMIYLQI